ncbi:MAG: hypothetical protein M1822_004125 [Bathelium mastoideum]|nr:MAG: hypothetical protein M1822_004125 [Bathelium mastoideum]
MAICAICQEPLLVDVEQDEPDEVGGSATSKTVPDDVQLSACGCHFHWHCVLESHTSSNCPNCDREIVTQSSTGEQEALCSVTDEGGTEPNFDILPFLIEEAYFSDHPEERRCRAFLEFCREGDVQAIVQLLKDYENTFVWPASSRIDILRYQDPIGDRRSGLHAAIDGDSIEAAWLLLFLASKLDLKRFPVEILREAETQGLMREDQAHKADIRSLQDAHGKLPLNLVEEKGGVWKSWVALLQP